MLLLLLLLLLFLLLLLAQAQAQVQVQVQVQAHLRVSRQASGLSEPLLRALRGRAPLQASRGSP